MSSGTDEAAFAALVARSGLPLTPAQIAAVREGYALLEPLLERLHQALPREAEPALTFAPRQS
jgi:hypothetical protein